MTTLQEKGRQVSDLQTKPISYSDAMTLTLPEMDIDGIKVVRIVIDEAEAKHGSLRAMISGTGRGRIQPGTYTKVLIDGRLWMSDTPDEKWDHYTVFRQMQIHGGRVLINGLGAGMILQAALQLDNVTHIDVVERDPRILQHIAPHYADDRVTFHEADAYTIKWPTGTRWDVVWHDIWLELSEDNLEGMATLHRRYGRRCEWQGSWGKEFLLDQRRRSRGWAF